MWQSLMDDRPLAGLDKLLRKETTHYASLQTLRKGETQ